MLTSADFMASAQCLHIRLVLCTRVACVFTFEFCYRGVAPATCTCTSACACASACSQVYICWRRRFAQLVFVPAERYSSTMANTWNFPLFVFVLLIGNMGAEAAYSAICRTTDCHVDYQVTKDCCTAVANGQKGWKKAQQHFDEPSHNCLSNNLFYGNSVNDGDVAKCCTSRGTDSASSPGNNARIFNKNAAC